MVDPTSDHFQPCQLSLESSSWRAVRIIPDHPSQRLRILFAPRGRCMGNDDIEERLSEMMSTFWEDDLQPSQLGRIQTWEYETGK